MRLTAVLAILLSGLLVIPQIAAAQQAPLRTVSVSGEGLYRVEPDMAVVRFGVVSRSDDPEEARRENASRAAQAMDAVRALGIEERKLRMESLHLQPWREYNNETRRWEEKGFEAVREVVVTVHDLNLLPELVARVVQQGANRLNQVSYELENRNVARNEALVRAVEDARAKAELMASTLGVSLGQVRTISEQQFDFPRPMYRAEMQIAASMDAAAPEPNAFAAGEIEVRTTVNVVFDLN